MKKGGKANILVVISFIVFLIALLHTSAVILLGSGIDLRSGITGNISLAPTSLLNNYLQLATTSKLVIAAEWLAVIIIVLVILIAGSRKLSKDMKKEKDLISKSLKKEYNKTKPQTDLDVLNNVLQRKKILRMNAVSKFFNVDKDIVMEWFKILEEAGLAEISYPTVGDPKIISTKKDVSNNEKKKKRSKA